MILLRNHAFLVLWKKGAYMSEIPTDPSIDTGMPKRQEKPQTGTDVTIPEKYQGMPSEMVEEMWIDPQNVDESKNQQLAERRTKAIEAIKLQEQIREGVKAKELEGKYNKLPSDQKKSFVVAQQEAVSIIDQAIRGERQIDDMLSLEEQWVLNKARDIYEQEKERDPDVEPTLEFSKQIDQTVYGNLINRLTFALLFEKSQLDDQTKANEIRNSIGIPEQPTDTSELTFIKDEEADPEKAKAMFIKEAFEGIAGSVSESSLAKVKEYDDRIKAVKEGNPIKPEDTLGDLMSSFKRFTKQEWSDDFDFETYKNSYKQADQEQPVKPAENPMVQNENSDNDPMEGYIKSAKEDLDQYVSQIELQRGQTLSMHEKLQLLDEGFFGNDLYNVKVRESLLKPEDYIDIGNISGDSERKITWHDFDEDDTGEYVYLYRGLSGRTEGQEHLSGMASSGQSKDEILSAIGDDKLAIMKKSSDISGAWGSDPVLHTTRSKKLASGFSGGNENGAVISYKIPKQWIAEHKNDVALGHQEEKEIDVFYGLPEEFIDKIEKTSDLS